MARFLLAAVLAVSVALTVIPSAAPALTTFIHHTTTDPFFAAGAIAVMQPVIWLHKQDVAARYSISDRTADRWVKAGKLPPWKYLYGRPVQSKQALDAHDKVAVTKQPTAKAVAALERTPA
jgi:hypothetical protein